MGIFMKKIMGGIVLAFSFIAVLYLICFSGNPIKYEACITDKEQLNKIAARWPARAVAQFLRSSK